MASSGLGVTANEHDRTHEAAKLFLTYAGEHPEFLFLTLMLTSIPSAVVILALVLSHGDTTILVHSLVDSRNGFRSGPEGRGTLSLVWSCVSTIFTLIYVSVHLDVPNEHEVARSRNCFHDAVRSIWRSFRSNLPLMLWMLLNIFAPSLLVLVATMEYQSARDGVKFMRDISQGQWTRRHAFFADMGGFKYEGKPFRTGRDFYAYIKQAKPRLDYDKIQEEIRDRSNKNTVLKVLTFFQASWFIAQSIVRGIEQRAISQLEVTTCAYIFSLMAAYLFWIRKPYHINGRIPLETYMLETPKEQCQRPTPPPPVLAPLPRPGPSSSAPNDPAKSQLASTGSQNDAEKGDASRSQHSQRPPLHRGWTVPSTYLKVLSAFRLPSVGRTPSIPLPGPAEPPNPILRNAHFSPFNRAMFNPNRAWAYSCFTSGIVGALVGLIHLLPFWNWDFANPMGKPLWRVCGIAQIALTLGLATNSVLERYMPPRFLKPLWFGVVVMSFAFCVSRAVIFVLIWYSFASLPDAVYDSIDWSWFPHWY